MRFRHHAPCPGSLAATLLLSGAVWLMGGAFAAATPVNYVIQISVDALRGDLLKNLVANSPATYPNFARLQAQSAYTYNARTDYDTTVTIPNHASMITGRPLLNPAGGPNNVGHGYSNDSPPAGDNLQDDGNPNVSYIASTFDIIHDNGLSTQLLASKTKFAFYVDSYDATRGAPDLIGSDNGTDKIDYHQLTANSSATVVNTLVANMAANPYTYTFLHLLEPDAAGHSGGWGNDAWNASVAVVDSRLGQIFDLIDNNPLLAGHTAITLTADHGGGVPTKSHTTITAPENYTIPLFVWGAGLPAGSDLYYSFSNRFDPGTTRPNFLAAQQPLRNGDAANITMALLGLDEVAGSLMRPDFAFAGDTNGDGVVDFTDLNTLLSNYGLAGSFAQGDFDKDGSVQFADLNMLLTNYSLQAHLQMSVTPIPEPASWLLAGLGVFGLALSRFGRRAAGGQSSDHQGN